MDKWLRENQELNFQIFNCSLCWLFKVIEIYREKENKI
jgi:hypothetical protein